MLLALFDDKLMSLHQNNEHERSSTGKAWRGKTLAEVNINTADGLTRGIA
jgi:hypothetical protein